MANTDEQALSLNFSDVVKMTAPGTPLRHALDMMIAGHLGALICIGDIDAVLAAGDDGFPLEISFTANRLFELAKMDGAIVIDRDLTQILRANFHLNPDPSLPTSETGMRHRTAARMSLKTHAMVISVSERRQSVNVYLGGRAYQIRPVTELMGEAGQLMATLQATRATLDRSLPRLTSLELDNYATLADVTQVLNRFELLMAADRELRACIAELGREGATLEMQRIELMGDMDATYTLMLRDYAADSSEENAVSMRSALAELAAKGQVNTASVAAALGRPDAKFDSVMEPLGLRTLSRISVVREGMADKIIDELGSLQELLDDDELKQRLNELGIRHPTILAESLSRMRDK